MIQSGKFDSSNMDIKKLANSIIIFIVKRLIEIYGIFISILGVLLLLSFVSYSPDDPNFIFPKDTEIQNFLGFQGSYTSDLFFQSIGLIAFLIPLTFLLSGINTFRKKEFFLFIENLFFVILYCLLGSLFFNNFYNESFNLYINGNGGFVGNYLNQTFLNSLILMNETVFYYILITLIIVLFLISINFRPLNFYNRFKKFLKFSIKKEEKNYTDKSEIINEYIPQDQIKNLIQKDLPFIKAENKNAFSTGALIGMLNIGSRTIKLLSCSKLVGIPKPIPKYGCSKKFK